VLVTVLYRRASSGSESAMASHSISPPSEPQLAAQAGLYLATGAWPQQQRRVSC
jgi:hypothetical protein